MFTTPEILRRGIQRDERVTSPREWAVNLAIFRIIFFGFVALPRSMGVYRWAVRVLPNLPDSLWAPVSFYRFVPLGALHNVGLVQILAGINTVAILFALLGYRTRIATALAALLSLYLFGLMENQGKIDHFHHVIWVMAMLAAGPTGEMFSVDAVLSAIKRADAGEVQNPILNNDALKLLRYIWVLLGLLYVGSGLAKLQSALTSGWAGAVNLQNLLLRKWIELSWYDPHFTLPLRIDRLPHWVLEPLGWSAILFEVGFIFFVLFRMVRPTLALAGLLFHLGNGLFLGIWFTTLFPVYVCLFDWVAIIKKLARRRRGESLIIYDGDCRICRRTIAILKCLDVYDALTPISGASDDPRKAGLNLTDKMIERDLYWARDGQIASGYDAYVQIARDLIFLKPLALIMAFAPVAIIGRRMYRGVADSRRCSLTKLKSPSGTGHQKAFSLHAVGVLLVLGQLSITGTSFVAGPSRRYIHSKQWFSPVAALVNGVSRCRWPFDMYPTFADMTSGKFQIYECRWVLEDGRELLASPDAYWNAFGNTGLTSTIMTDLGRHESSDHKGSQELDLAKLLWRKEKLSFEKPVVAARIYRVRYSLQSARASLVSCENQTLQFSFPVDSLVDDAQRASGDLSHGR